MQGRAVRKGKTKRPARKKAARRERRPGSFSLKELKSSPEVAALENAIDQCCTGFDCGVVATALFSLYVEALLIGSDNFEKFKKNVGVFHEALEISGRKHFKVMQ